MYYLTELNSQQQSPPRLPGTSPQAGHFGPEGYASLALWPPQPNSATLSGDNCVVDGGMTLHGAGADGLLERFRSFRRLLGARRERPRRWLRHERGTDSPSVDELASAPGPHPRGLLRDRHRYRLQRRRPLRHRGLRALTGAQSARLRVIPERDCPACGRPIPPPPGTGRRPGPTSTVVL